MNVQIMKPNAEVAVPAQRPCRRSAPVLGAAIFERALAGKCSTAWPMPRGCARDGRTPAVGKFHSGVWDESNFCFALRCLAGRLRRWPVTAALRLGHWLETGRSRPSSGAAIFERALAGKCSTAWPMPRGCARDGRTPAVGKFHFGVRDENNFCFALRCLAGRLRNA